MLQLRSDRIPSDLLRKRIAAKWTTLLAQRGSVDKRRTPDDGCVGDIGMFASEALALGSATCIALSSMFINELNGRVPLMGLARWQLTAVLLITALAPAVGTRGTHLSVTCQELCSAD